MNDNARKIPLHEWLIVGAAWAVLGLFALYIVLAVKEAIFG
jgi:hypothetical protein